jgi:N-hydroxyarylamine O-acetyltransferase
VTDTPTTPLDLDAYLARTGYAGPLVPGAEVLSELHLAHVTHIPFENLDVQLGRPIRIDLDSLQAKLVHGRRGGYCFEQNTLFAAVLERVGFRVTRLAARVRSGTTRVLPRTHMVLKVDGDGGSWLADVGFGGEGLLKPVLLAAGQAVRHYAWTYRVVSEDGAWVLQSLHRGTWVALYTFTPEPQFDVDYEVANHYTSTHPSSRFVTTLTVQLATSDARYVLRDRELTVWRGDESEARAVAEGELLDLLAGTLSCTALKITPVGP